MMGAKTLESQIAVGTVKVAGDVSILKKFGSTMVEFDPRFEIIPGTKPPRGPTLNVPIHLTWFRVNRLPDSV